MNAEKEYQKVREERRHHDHIEHDLRKQLRSEPLVLPRDMPAPEGITSTAQAVERLERVYEEAVEELLADLEDAGIGDAYHEVELDLARLWRGTREAVLDLTRKRKLTERQYGSMVAHTAHYLSLNVAAFFEVVEERELPARNHAKGYLAEWQRKFARDIPEEWTEEASALAFGSDEEAKQALGLAPKDPTITRVGREITIDDFDPGPEES